MKTAIIFSEGVKQIVLTPENEDEKFALSLITPNDDIQLLIKTGSIGEPGFHPFTASPGMCQGDYLRIYESDESKILVLIPREKKDES